MSVCYYIVMTTKTCKQCNKEKELSEFRKNEKMNDGYINQCKECIAKRNYKWRLKNTEKLLKQKKQYYKDNKKYFSDYSKKYNKENKDEIRKANKTYVKKYKEEHGETPSNKWQREHKKETSKRYNRWYHKNNEECRKKSNCRRQTYTLLKDRGIDKDNQSCIVCGKKAIIHHWDYSNPFDIEWYCTDCHMGLHKILRKEEKYGKN